MWVQVPPGLLFYSLVTHYVAWELLIVVVDNEMRTLGTVDRIVGQTVRLSGWLPEVLLRLKQARVANYHKA